ncbi:hypothetical protein [Peribacillus kribbensis]|uniref:hypothetical protein n=1 Tax=Peribacillus kribbensis TaxID=356658 RepID=UPI00042544E8|nr:hypothetical protein [Peribacillus kribbensis]
MYSISVHSLFDYRYILPTLFFAALGCIIAVEVSTRVKKQKDAERVLYWGSLTLAGSFLACYYLVLFSMNASAASKGPLNFIFIFLFCLSGSFGVLKLSQISIHSHKQYIVGSLLVGTFLMIINILSYSISFKDDLEG